MNRQQLERLEIIEFIASFLEVEGLNSFYLLPALELTHSDEPLLHIGRDQLKCRTERESFFLRERTFWSMILIVKVKNYVKI